MEGTTVLVTGGAGFVGRALLERLLAADPVLPVREVRVLDVAPFRHSDPRVVPIRGDVRDASAVRAACGGARVVFHLAAVVDWGRVDDAILEAVNAGGTRNVVAACRDAGVEALVHTSTLDVIYTGGPVRDGDESLPEPAVHANAYCATKAAAERLARAANGGSLRTAVIRPMSVWGEGDPFHIGSLLEASRFVPLVRIGRGEGRTNFVYVGNLAHAEVLAARALLAGDPRVAGGVYFVTDFPPRNFFDQFEPVLTALGRRVMPRRLGLPHGPTRAVGALLEATARGLRPIFPFTPMLTTFAADFTCLEFTFRGDRARDDLGYRPVFDEAQAYARTIDWYRRHPPR